MKTKTELSVKKQHELNRRKIITFCNQPRTVRQIAEKLNISGGSVGGYVSALRLKGTLTHDLKAGTYTKVSKSQAKKKGFCYKSVQPWKPRPH